MEQLIDNRREMEDAKRLIRVKPGEHGRKVMPHSEVCLHMRIAGRTMAFALLNNGGVQLHNDDETPFSIPITNGEAGIYKDDDGFYYYSQAENA